MRDSERIYTGYAVVNGKIRFFSVSQIKLFDPASDGCNLKWWYQYVGGRRLKKTGALSRGIEGAEKLEHFLKTGEDVLPPVLHEARKFFPAPGPDLEVEQPLGPDFPTAVFLREALLKPEYAQRQDIVRELQRLAGLTLCGIPLDGAADFRHRRGIFINEDGELQSEHPDMRVTEIGDLKLISRIVSQKIKKGPNTGMILQGWAKTSAQVCEDTQMIGYARREVDQTPSATHIRLSHIYGQKSSKGAAKRTGLVSVDEVLRRWRKVETTGEKMIATALMRRAEDVETNVSACDAYTHIAPDGSEQKGCGHKYYCPRSSVAAVQNLFPQKESSAMSLFDQVPSSALPTTPAIPSIPVPPTPQLDSAAERLVIEEEKRRLLEEDRSLSLPVGNGCGAPGCGYESAPGWIKTATPGIQDRCKACAGTGKRALVPTPPVPQSSMAVLPPDVPAPQPLLQAAGPLPAAAIAEISDPVLRKTVEEHAVEHQKIEAARLVKEQAEKEAAGTSVWCSMSNQRLVLTVDMALTKKYDCKCGKIIKLKPVKVEGNYEATIQKHKPAKIEATNQLSLPGEAAEVAAGKDEEDEMPALPLLPPIPSLGQCVCGTLLDDSNTSRLQSGILVHVGCAYVPQPPTPSTAPAPAPSASTNGHTNGAQWTPPAPPTVVIARAVPTIIGLLESINQYLKMLVEFEKAK